MKTLSPQQQRMIDKAKAKHGIILPCGKTVIFKNGFTEHEGDLYFWFNDKAGSTHVIKEVKDEKIY